MCIMTRIKTTLTIISFLVSLNLGQVHNDDKAPAGEQVYFAFQYGLKAIPGPGKEKKGGEDAWFAHDYLLSVADGVGGWVSQGVDPAIYSRKLENNVKQYFERNQNYYRTRPKELMKIAADNNKEKGSSTFIIVTLNPTKPILHTSLLGDSSYFLIRKNAIGEFQSVFRSEEQQHGFNFPFQCGSSGDPISKAIENSHEVKLGDMVIVGTDGIFDNLYDADILEIVNYEPDGEVNALAMKIAQIAYNKSKNKSYISPFAANAKKAGMSFDGGKEDDITVLVGVIRKAVYN